MDYTNIIKRVQQQKQVDAIAITKHLEATQALAPIIQQFDGKVINKRFETACKKFGSFYLEVDKLTSFYNESISVNGRSVYTSQSEQAFALVLDGEKRLQAEETMQNLEQHIDRLQRELKKTDFDQAKTLEQYTKLEAIANQLDELLEGMDYTTRKEVARVHYRLNI